jgi:hypothetical protein
MVIVIKADTFRHADSQSDSGAFRYHSGFPYFGTGLVQAPLFSAIWTIGYRKSSWQILEQDQTHKNYGMAAWAMPD